MKWSVSVASLLAITTFTSGVTAATITKTLTGHISPDQVFSFVYVPFDVPVGTTSIYVLQNYTQKGQGNSVDLGCFDQRGHDILAGNASVGFRGWSGGFRNNFTISPVSATPGYIPGPIEPGQWNVALGPYTSNPGGIDYELQVVLSSDPYETDFTPNFAPSSVGADPAMTDNSDDEDLNIDKGSWYRGDLHLHTYYSDGQYAPQEIVDYAQRRDLNFIFSTDHNTQSSNLMWGSLAPPSLLIGRGIEATTRNGHWGALGLERWQWVDWRYTNDTVGLNAAKQQVRDAGGFVSINHPYAACPACNWTFPFNDFDGIEVWNSDWDPTDDMAVQEWQRMLVQGANITAVGGSDAHRAPQVVGLPTTVVRATGLSTAAVLEGLKRRRAYLVRDPGMDIHFTVQTIGGVHTQVGDRIKVRGPAIARLQTTGMNNGTATFFYQKGQLYQQVIENGRDITHNLQGADWIRVEIRNATGSMLGLTNPIWLK
ncbi:hypothetical protein Unana1_05424 [Umbelopsis nana]